MFKKNTAVTGFGIGHFINATTGSAVTTGTPTCKRTIDGTGGACANTASYNTDGATWEIDLAAADLNGDMIALSFTLADCLPISYAFRTVTGIPDANGRFPANATAISDDATAADTLELFAEALDQSTGQVDAGSIAASALDSKGDWATAANVGTPATIDGQAATIAGMLAASYDRADNNAGFDRLPIYGDDKLFDLASGESYATFPSIVYDSVAGNWRCYYIALVGGARCVRVRISTDGKTSWGDPTTVLLPSAVGANSIWTVVVWRESATDWRMLYTAYGSSAANIHYATSTDGLTWTNYASNPVVSADQDWDVDLGLYHRIEVTGVMKVSTTYYIYFATIHSTGHQRKTGVAWTTDFVTFTRQTDPVFGDPGFTDVQEPYSGYFSGTPFTSSITGGVYYLLVTPYEHGSMHTRMEMWASKSPLFSANNRRLVKTILTCGHGTTFPNRKLDCIGIATDNVSQNTFTAAGGEIRLYFGAEHSTLDDATKVWYTALATATSIYDLLKPINVGDEITRGRMPQQRGQLTQANLTDALADTAELQTELADGGRTDMLIDGIAAKTTNLPADPADQSAVEAAVTAATSPLATTAALAIVAGYVDTEVGDIRTAVVTTIPNAIAAVHAKTTNIPASPAAVGSVMVVADKTGFSLAATGLDQISATPVANPTTWVERVNWLVQKLWHSSKTPTEVVIKDNAGAPLTTQAITDDGAGTETMGPPTAPA